MEQNNSVNNNKQRRPLILYKCTYLIFQAENFFLILLKKCILFFINCITNCKGVFFLIYRCILSWR